MNLQVLTKESDYPSKPWATAGNLLYSYTECSGTPPGPYAFSGRLTLVRQPAARAYRIVATYKTETANCNTGNIDYEAPAVAITIPAANGVVSNSGNFTVKNTVSDNVGVTALEIYINGKKADANAGLVSTNPGTGDIVFNFGTPKQYLTDPPSQYTMTTKAIDAAGNVGTSWPVTFTVTSSNCAPSCGGATPFCTPCTCSGVTTYTCLASGASCPFCNQTPGE
jgi:hypothetical protein